MAAIRVECYAGSRGDETPRAVTIGARRIAVIDVLDRWIAPDHRYFKIKGDDGAIYIIRYSNASDSWELTMFNRAEGQD
jgi:hypothetical protein